MPETVSACFATNTNLRLVRYKTPLVDHLRGQAFTISPHRTQQNFVRWICASLSALMSQAVDAEVDALSLKRDDFVLVQRW